MLLDVFPYHYVNTNTTFNNMWISIKFIIIHTHYLCSYCSLFVRTHFRLSRLCSKINVCKENDTKFVLALFGLWESSLDLRKRCSTRKCRLRIILLQPTQIADNLHCVVTFVLSEQTFHRYLKIQIYHQTTILVNDNDFW